jgi:hypothetical protein
VKAQCFWAKNIGPAILPAFKTTVDLQGNIYTTGGISNTSGTVDFDFGPGVVNLIGGNGIFLAKYDANSNLIWVKAINLTNPQYFNIKSIAVDANGNVILTGYFVGTVDFDGGTGTFNLTALGAQDMFLLKLNSLGNFVWAKKAGGSITGFSNADVGNDVDVDPAGNIYVVGNIYGASIFVGTNTAVTAGAYGAFIAKYDANGNFLWVKLLDGNGTETGYSIDLDSTGNIYTTGVHSSSGIGATDFDPGAGVFNITSAGGYDVFISKLDANGNFLWAKSIGGLSNDEGHSIKIDAIGNIFVSGSFMYTDSDFDPGVGVFNMASLGAQDIFICKLDPSGNFLWAKQFGNTNDDMAIPNTIDTDASGNLYITGPFQGVVDFDPGNGVLSLVSAGSNDVYLNKFDSNGNILYAKQFGSTGDDNVNSIILDVSDNIILTGFFYNVVDFNTGVGTFNLTTHNALWPDIFIYKDSPISQPTITSSGSPIICSGNSVTLTSNITSGNTWSNGATTQSITVNSSGNYYTSVFNGSCTATSAPIAVTIVQAVSTPTVSVSGPLTFCQGDSVILTSSSATGYTWSTGATTQSITVSSSGTYSVIVLNASGCTAASNSITVTVNPNSATPTITANGPLTFCEGDSVVLSSNFPENSLHDNNWFNGNTVIGNNNSVTITTSGTYYVRHYYTPGTNYCPSNSAPVSVNVLPRPPTPSVTANGPLTICQGNSVILNSSSAANNIWSNGATSPSITVYNSGNYFLQITDGVCTSLSSIPVTITTVNPPIIPSITVNGSLTLCKGEMVQLISNQTSNVLWSNGETTNYIDIYEAGTYSYSVSNGVCPTLTSSPVLISVNNLDAIITTFDQLAENSTNTSITFTANATNAGTTPTYEWYKNGLAVGSNSATYTNNNWVNGEKIVCKVTSSSGCSVYSNDLFVWLAQTTSDSWQRMADVGLDKNMVTPLFPTRIGAVSFTIGDKIYVGLGYDDKKGLPSVPNVGYLSDFWEYNTITDEWTERAPFAFGNSPRMDAIAFVVDGRGYVGFGKGNLYYNDLWEYNPQTDSWIQKSNCPGIGRHSAVATNVGMSGYVGTGWGFNTYLNDWWKYTPATNSWSQLANYPFSYFGLNCAAVNSRIYVSGSSSALTNAFSINYEYNPDSNTWSQKSPMPGNRYYSESFVINDTIFHCGGQSNPANCQSAVTYDEVWAYYPPNDSWVQKSNIHLGKISNGCAASVNGYGYYISGGYNPVCQAPSGWNYDGYGRETNLKYSPHTDSWEVKAVHGGLKKYFGFSTTIGDKGFALFQYSGLTGNALTNMDIFEVYLFEYDPSNNIWKQKSKYPGQGIYQAGNGFSINGKIYYGAGSSSNNIYVNDFWEYNPVTNTWTNIGDVPISSNKGFSFVLNGKGYIGGSQMGTSFFEFNPAFYSWIQRASIPALSSGNINFSLNNLGYINLGTSSTVGSLYKYDPSINIWTFVNTLPNYSASVASNYFSFQTTTKGYYGTAINLSTSPLTTSFIYEFNPLINSWVQKQTLPENHSTGGTFSFPNNSYVFSGNQYYPPHTAQINSIWQYKPDYSNITSTFNESTSDKQRFNIFPNPTTSVINVEKTEDIGISEISIYDILGRKLSTMIPENNSVIQIEMPLMPGTYYLKIQDVKGKGTFFKVLKI